MDNSTQQIQSDDMPIFDKATIPAGSQIILLVEESNFDTGGTLGAAYRLPIERVTPGSSLQSSVYSLTAPNGDYPEVAAQTVLPAYVEQFSPNNIRPAQANSSTTKAQFLILGPDPNISGNVFIQASGFYSFPTVHTYNVGAIYYLSSTAPGGVTTTPPGIAQPLFTVVDQKTIHIQIGA